MCCDADVLCSTCIWQLEMMLIKYPLFNIAHHYIRWNQAHLLKMYCAQRCDANERCAGFEVTAAGCYMRTARAKLYGGAAGVRLSPLISSRILAVLAAPCARISALLLPLA